jgi:hypothetical protein
MLILVSTFLPSIFVVVVDIGSLHQAYRTLRDRSRTCCQDNFDDLTISLYDLDQITCQGPWVQWRSEVQWLRSPYRYLVFTPISCMSKGIFFSLTFRDTVARDSLVNQDEPFMFVGI